MSYQSFEDMKPSEGRPRSGSPDSVANIDVLAAAKQVAANTENLDLDSFLATDTPNKPLLNNLKEAMRAYKDNQTEENEKEVVKIFDEMLRRKDKNIGRTKTLRGRKRYVFVQNPTTLGITKVNFGEWRHNQTNPLTKQNNPAFFGGRRKKKTRKKRGGRRRKKRTKKKTRRKRRKSRKRKTKRRRRKRRGKKTRKRKAGCWPFCITRPRVLEEEPLVQQQQQEAPTMTDAERQADNINRLIVTSSGNRSWHTERRHARLAANEAAAKKAANTQGGD